MIIKKKHVLLESLLIDTTSEFTPQEKKLLSVIHQKFGMGSGEIEKSWDFDRWKAAAFLIEFFETPYDVAHDLSTTYYWNGDKLFKDHESLRKKNNRGDLFMNFVFRDILDEYIESKKNDRDQFYLTNNIEYVVKTQNETEVLPGIKEGDANARNHRDYMGGLKEVSEVKLSVRPLVWASYNGILLYIQPSEENIIEPKHIDSANWDTLRNMGMTVGIRLEYYKEEGEKSNNYIKAKCEYKFGHEFKDEGIVWSEDIKLPEVLSKENVIKFIEMLIEKIRSTINGKTFIYGSGKKNDGTT
jgi:hypothetical protein